MEVMRKAEDWTQVLFPVLKEQHHLLDGTFGYKDVRPSTSAFIKELLIHRPIEYIILRQVHTHALLVVIELDYMSATVKSNLSRDFIQANRFTKVSQFKPGVERRLVTSDGNVLQSLITLLVHDLLNDILISRIFWAKRMSNPDDSDCLVLVFGSTVEAMVLDLSDAHPPIAIEVKFVKLHIEFLSSDRLLCMLAHQPRVLPGLILLQITTFVVVKLLKVFSGFLLQCSIATNQRLR